MSIESIQSASASYVAETMTAETFAADVVTKTLDTLNAKDESSSSKTDYTFQRDVLDAVYTGRGTILDDLA
jgi:hypothetical protein